jgi:hypothetical protein
MGAPTPPRSCSQQAARLVPADIRSGRSTRQRAPRTVQRGLKAQPGGISVSRGMAPSIWVSLSWRTPKLGIEPISPLV